MARRTQKFTLYSEHPTVHDLLGYRDIAAQFIELIRDMETSPSPAAFAITGGSGMGKSSLLQLIEQQLADIPDAVPVTFNLWQRQEEANLVQSLLGGLAYELSFALEKDQVQQLKALTGKLFECLDHLAFAQNIHNAAPDTETNGKDAKGKNLSDYRKYQGYLREMVRLVAGEFGRLVLFIDDVDKAHPAVSYHFLSLVHSHLQFPNSVVFLGADEEQLLEQWEQAGLCSWAKGQALWNHIVKFSQDLPPLTPRGIRAYLDGLKIEGDFASQTDLLVEALAGSTPREIKLFLNRLKFEYPSYAKQGLTPKAFLLLKAVETMSPDFLAHLYAYDKKLLAAVGGSLRAQETAEGSDDFLRRLPGSLREAVLSFLDDGRLAFFLKAYLPDMMRDLIPFVIQGGPPVATVVVPHDEDSLDDLELPSSTSGQGVRSTKAKAPVEPEPEPEDDEDLDEPLDETDDDNAPFLPDDEEEVEPTGAAPVPEEALPTPFNLDQEHRAAKSGAFDPEDGFFSLKDGGSKKKGLELVQPAGGAAPQPPQATAEKPALNRKQVQMMYEQGKSLEGENLSGADLRDMDLKGINMKGSNLSFANLERANLRKANLSEAFLNGAALIGANLMDANLKNSICDNTDFMGANLWGAELQHGHLLNAHFRGANMRATNLQGADLTSSNLMGAELVDSNLTECNLTGVVLDQHSSFHFACIADTTMDEKTKELVEKKYTVNEKNILMPKLQNHNW